MARLREAQQDAGGGGGDHTTSGGAFGTGGALSAMSRCDGINQTAIEKARAFLIRTQIDDGSWLVPSAKKVRNNKPGATSNYWGTCWAVIGLVSTE